MHHYDTAFNFPCVHHFTGLPFSLTSSKMAPMNNISQRLGVCSWSLQPENPQALLRMMRETGISRVLLALDPLREKPEIWGNTAELSHQQGIELVAGMFGCVGEDYTTLDSIKKSGGVVPDQTWDQNWKNIGQTVELAAKLGFKLVMFHAGFLPHEEKDPAFAKMVDRLRKIANLFASKGIDIAFETGQESAPTLKSFLEKLNCPNVGVNFDPANMILYDNGNPIEAMQILAPWIKQIHLKDATRTKVPGTWGEEVVLGTGEVDWKAFFRVLDSIGYKGQMFIEREAGSQRVQDIRIARIYVEALKY